MERPAMKVRIDDRLLLQELDGEAVLLSPQSGKYFGLNPVGTRIFTLLRQGHSREAVVEILIEEFEVDAQRAGQDLEGFLAELAEAGLVDAG
jgi:hypothetical protein